MSYRLQPDEINPAWNTLKIEVVFAPKTGSLRPWEIHACFTFPINQRVHWSSFKTEQAANKKLETLRKFYKTKYPQSNP